MRCCTWSRAVTMSTGVAGLGKAAPEAPTVAGADRKRCNRTLPSASRQTQVQQHGVKPLGAQSAPSTGHIATHIHGITALLQRGAQACGDACIVFNHQDSHGRIVTASRSKSLRVH